MAFLRSEKKGAATYLRIIESYRDKEGKSKHRTLYNLGKAEDYSPQALKNIGQAFIELGGGDPRAFSPRTIEEQGRFYYGFIPVVKQLLKTYGLQGFLEGITRDKKLAFSVFESVLLLVCERWHDPVSKLDSFLNQGDYLGIAALDLQHIYRTLDHLHEREETIKRLIYSTGRNLFNQKLDVVFYDVTTFYFDSDKEDSFREKGFGKDGKIGKTIITFGLLIDKDKQPVGYEVYRGRQYEGHTFADALSRVKEKYQIDKVICVADTGMMNAENVEDVLKAEYEFIFGERLRSLSRDVQDELLDLSRYTTISIEEDTIPGGLCLQYYTTWHHGKRLIATYSTKRAAKDRAEREEKLKKALAFLENPSGLKKKAKFHFLKNVGKDQYILDQEKIKRDERFDGFFCIATNNTGLSEVEILMAYKQLHKIESSFRTFKTFLETRPMFHWTEKRILGHLALCYIAFTLLNHLQIRLSRQGTPQSENQIRANLSKMQMSLITQNEGQFYLRSKMTDGGRNILKSLSLREPPDLIPSGAINQYL